MVLANGLQDIATADSPAVESPDGIAEGRQEHRGEQLSRARTARTDRSSPEQSLRVLVKTAAAVIAARFSRARRKDRARPIR